MLSESDDGRSSFKYLEHPTGEGQGLEVQNRWHVEIQAVDWGRLLACGKITLLDWLQEQECCPWFSL